VVVKALVNHRDRILIADLDIKLRLKVRKQLEVILGQKLKRDVKRKKEILLEELHRICYVENV
jgi:hypothetical protein